MEWCRRVEIEPLERSFGREELITLWGSCFAEELQQYLYRELYTCSFSPFGISYNPISMGEGLRYLLSTQCPSTDMLIEHNGLWHSPMHHGSFSQPTPHDTLQLIQKRLKKAREEAKRTKLWVFTFGTSYIYEWAEAPHQVVNNCHRMPASCFRRRRVSVGEIVALWEPLLEVLTSRGAEVLFTVSPIAHYRDGAHQNRLSKAVLLLAIDELVAPRPSVHYFPSYELQLDELRDYRFFREDMAHPTEQAVGYILERFKAFALRGNPAFDKEWYALRKLAWHRPLSTNPTIVANHYTKVRKEISRFAKSHPHPYLQELLNQLNQNE